MKGQEIQLMATPPLLSQKHLAVRSTEEAKAIGRLSADHAMGDDINQAFEDLLFCEERITQNAYEDGFKVGQAEGNPDGYHLGYHRGAEIGAELGYYLGIVQIYLIKEGIKAKILTNLHKLKVLIEEFPKINDENIDFLEKVDDIRALYRKTCSLLKIDGKFPEADKMNF